MKLKFVHFGYLFVLGVFIIALTLETLKPMAFQRKGVLTPKQVPPLNLSIKNLKELIKNGLILVVGDTVEHGPSKHAAGETDYVVAWKLMSYFKREGIDSSMVMDTSISRSHPDHVELLDHEHNLIAVGCHWVNTVTWHYLVDNKESEMVKAYPLGNPFEWPKAVYIKSEHKITARSDEITYGKSDYGFLHLIRDGPRYVVTIWSYHGQATVAGGLILQNIEEATRYDWDVDAQVLVFSWVDGRNNGPVDGSVQVEEIEVEPYKVK